jgi:hypothetical protein
MKTLNKRIDSVVRKILLTSRVIGGNGFVASCIHAMKQEHHKKGVSKDLATSAATALEVAKASRVGIDGLERALLERNEFSKIGEQCLR